MVNEKRNVRGYKVKDKYYNKAMKRAQKENGTVANLIENVIIGYASGMNVKLVNKDPFEQGVEDCIAMAEKNKALTKPTKGGKK